jgi:hypothetical protein
MCLQGLKNKIVLAVLDRVVEFRVSQGPCAFLIVYGFLFARILCTVVGTEAGDWGHIIWRLHQEHASSTAAQVLTVFPNPGSKTVWLKRPWIAHKLPTWPSKNSFVILDHFEVYPPNLSFPWREQQTRTSKELLWWLSSSEVLTWEVVCAPKLAIAGWGATVKLTQLWHHFLEELWESSRHSWL